MQNLNYEVNKETIIAAASPQAFTASWADLGAEIQMHGYNSLGVWLVLDVNNSLDMRLRARVKLDKDATNEYSLPIRSVGTAVVAVEQEYLEFNVDEDANYLIDFDTKGHAGFVQLQISAGTAGATPGQVDECIITKRYDA